MEQNGKTTWKEYLRLVTPILSFTALFVIATVKSDISRVEDKIACLDDKVFKHLTNDELHPLKSNLISKEQFAIYSELRTQQMDKIYGSLNEIQNRLRR